MTKFLVVVDDDHSIQHLVSELLAEENSWAICGKATTAEEAVAAVREYQPDIIILDHYIHGHVMGIDAAPLLKEAAPDVKILLFTAGDFTVEASLEDCIDGYLSKNDPTALVPKVRAMLADTAS